MKPVMRVGIEGIGLVGPGIADWTSARAVLAGALPLVPAATQVPQPASLPPAERRRSSQAVRLALAAGQQAIADSAFQAKDLVSVFASSGSDGANCHAICEALASDDRLLSPTRFHNSVHNAASGYWGIAVGAMASSTSIGAHDGSFGAGWLEAIGLVRAHAAPVLLVAYDARYPEPVLSRRPVADDFAVAIVLTPADDPHARAIVSTRMGDEPATVMDDAALESMRRGIPTARCLPLLQAMARRTHAAGTHEGGNHDAECTVVIDHLPRALGGGGATSLTLQITDPPAGYR